MAYPFAPMPTLEEFISWVTTQHGATVQNRVISCPIGTVEVKSIVRKSNNGTVKFCALPELKDTDKLVPTQVRSLCKQLGIPPEDFGLLLG